VTQQPMQTQEIEQNQPFSDDAVVMVPHLEQNIPIPLSARDALPDLNNEEELEMLANTVKLISDLTEEPIQATQEDIMEAKTIAETMIKNPETKVQLKKYKNSTLASLAGMVESINASVVDDLSDLKTVVVNGLLREAMTSEKSKERITALRAIGEIDGVNAFKKHTEVVHTSMSLDDIEEKLKVLVNKIQKRLDEKESQVIDAEIVKDE
jgi:carboxypeptidase C (cathepsin A)